MNPPVSLPRTLLNRHGVCILLGITAFGSCKLIDVPGIGSLSASPDPEAVVQAAEAVADYIDPAKLTDEQRVAFLASVNAMIQPFGMSVVSDAPPPADD